MMQPDALETGIRLVAAICLVVIGLSHALQPRAWVDFFVLLRRQGRTGAFVDGFLYLPFAAMIVTFHPVWSGVPAILTFLGWAWLIKSLVRFCLPGPSLRMLERVSPERAWEFVVPGVAFVVIGALLAWSALG